MDEELKLVDEALKEADQIKQWDGDRIMGAMVKVQAAQAMALVRIAQSLEKFADWQEADIARAELMQNVKIWGAE